MLAENLPSRPTTTFWTVRSSIAISIVLPTSWFRPASRMAPPGPTVPVRSSRYGWPAFGDSLRPTGLSSAWSSAAAARMNRGLRPNTKPASSIPLLLLRNVSPVMIRVSLGARGTATPTNRYHVYQSASVPVYDAYQDVKSAAASIQMDTKYQSSADLTVLHDHALAAAAAYNKSYQAARSAFAILSDDPSNVGEDLFTQGMQGSEDDFIAGLRDAVTASSSLMRLADADRNTKLANGCDPAQLQIYSDIQDKIGLNPQFTCAQDGYTAPLDVSMCELYRAYNPYDRDRWTIIPRPQN
jgi:hypothetical protein